MSTLVEIQEAVAKLRDDEKKALSVWLESQATVSLNAEEERQLLCTLDEAVRDLDAGKGKPIEEVRELTRSWVAK